MSLPTQESDNAEIEDYLDEDKPIPGQKYVCLSFVSPEHVLEDKKLYTLYKFMKSQNPDMDMDMEYEKFKDEYKNYSEDNEAENQSEFDLLSDFQTNIRGVKVRGVYDSERAANIRAQVLQKMDSSFHVYVGQVGFWLPWEPSADKIQEQEYMEDNLNKLVKEYNKNQVKKDMFYEEKKTEQKKAALEHSIRQKKKNDEERKKLLEEQKESFLEKSLDQKEETTAETTEEITAETTSETTASETREVTEENVKLDINEENELKENLEKMDPWMERKITQQNTETKTKPEETTENA
tara:strand:+ start:3480 stop:4364 length:885 start_codon:yes stop_codon:yes gene_type:complete